MARLAGVDLPRNKRMIIALTYIYGIGPARSAKILAACNISEDLRTDAILFTLKATIRATDLPSLSTIPLAESVGIPLNFAILKKACLICRESLTRQRNRAQNGLL